MEGRTGRLRAPGSQQGQHLPWHARIRRQELPLVRIHMKGECVPPWNGPFRARSKKTQ